ncbi:MAG: hypothetical protein GF416_01090 [Candidatus Altiarchaeales archaeon]|nr:hypothetical protein [Candidatus Altiarchaeales archaeon]MBD3415711.1 hypothetical protein [Candidatus Altiarchaeales archaeon]
MKTATAARGRDINVDLGDKVPQVHGGLEGSEEFFHLLGWDRERMGLAQKVWGLMDDRRRGQTLRKLRMTNNLFKEDKQREFVGDLIGDLVEVATRSGPLNPKNVNEAVEQYHRGLDIEAENFREKEFGDDQSEFAQATALWHVTRSKEKRDLIKEAAVEAVRTGSGIEELLKLSADVTFYLMDYKIRKMAREKAQKRDDTRLRERMEKRRMGDREDNRAVSLAVTSLAHNLGLNPDDAEELMEEVRGSPDLARLVKDRKVSVDSALLLGVLYGVAKGFDLQPRPPDRGGRTGSRFEGAEHQMAA